MQMTCEIEGKKYRFETNHPIDISIPLRFGGEQPNAFYLPRATAQVAEGGDFVGDTRQGGSVNCETVTLNPHGNGTHTECIGHLSNQRVAVRDVLRDALIPSLLLTVSLNEAEGGRAITETALKKALGGAAVFAGCQGLIIRTLPNDPAKHTEEYSGAKPAYVAQDAMTVIREMGIDHLVLDIPSADREDDPNVRSHRIFWGYPDSSVDPDAAVMGRTITEMAFVEDGVPDGLYMMTIQIPPFMLDAAPSRPLLFLLEETE